MARTAQVDSPRILVVDDEADIRELLELTLVRMGLNVDTAGSLAEARQQIAGNRYQLCLTDMRLPDGEGLSLVQEIGDRHPNLPVAVITAHGSMENAVSALKAGAFDYLAKPLALDQLRALVRGVLDMPKVPPDSVVALPSRLIGESSAMREVRTLIERVARSQAPVHVSGESGTGKELAARLIHQSGPRGGGPFIPVNCGAIPETLMESEFFGHRKGAFTGAEGDRDGFFQVAHGGTLFLDEVADLPLVMQVKLLRAIQEKRVRKLGDPAEVPVDVRIISATHGNLRQLVEQGKFRQDLYFRLNVIELRMPALRECREDIPLLAAKIVERLSDGAEAPLRLSAAALDALQHYPFPGNVRELENVLERAAALSIGPEIDPDDLGLVAAPSSMGETVEPGRLPLQDYLDKVERQAILDALQNTRYNRTAAAKLLGVTFRSLRYRMERLGLNEREH